jgi:hypothetical protein
VDRLTKVAHFIPVKTTYKGAKVSRVIYIELCAYMVYLIRLFVTEILVHLKILEESS